MSVVSNNILAGASGQGGSYEIERSLRFNGADTPELTFTPTSSGNTRTFTISFWTKRSTVGDTAMLLQTGDTYGNLFRLYFSADKLRFHQYDAGVYRYELITTQVFRDLSAWYHIVIAIDTTNATTSERAKIYVNGVQVTTFDIATYPASNRECGWNANIIQRIGREYTTTYGSYYNYNGYLAEFHNIDGQALAPTDFGETDDNGVWQPKEFAGSYTLAASGTTTSLSQTGWATSDQANLWDGNTSTRTVGAPLNSVGTVTFSPPLTNVTKVEFYVQDFHHFINGSQITTSQSGTGWHTYYDNSGSPITLTSLGASYTNNTQTIDAHAIRINGTIVNAQTWTPPSGVGLASSGANSFYLPFTDNSSIAALGTDTSGNGNTWTVTNFSVAGSNWNQSQTWSNGLSALSGSLTNPPNAFNGNTGSYADSTAGFSLDLSGHTFGTGSHSIEVKSGGATSFSVNGSTSLNDPGGGGAKVWTGTHTGELTSLASSATGASVYYVKIDNQFLVNTGISDPLAANIDSLVDTPTNGTQPDTGAGGEVVGNYATWNPLVQSTSTFSNGNLQATTSGGSGYPLDMANFYTPAGTGKWYWEFELSALSGANYTMVGMLPADSDYQQGVSNVPKEKGGMSVYVGYNGDVEAASGAATAGTGTATFAVGDILGWAFDAENGTLQCYKNGVSQGTQFTNIRTDIGWVFCVTDYDNSAAATYVINFGQRAFTHAAPSGYKALCTANLPDPTIEDGSKYFDTTLWSGNATARSISTNFAPGFVWTKLRNTGNNHKLFDIVRGAEKRLESSTTNAEATESGTLTAFNSDGFSLGTTGNVNGSGYTYAAWAWDAGTSGANEVGSYWSPPYNTKYIGFKFPTSGGGRAVFGLESGTGIADIYTSPDNSSWTRVQQNVTLSTTDTTYDSSAQYLIVVNTSDATWGAHHYAMATNGTDGHYSAAAYPGSGASFTWSGPGYTDWDFRSSGTVIKPGSLNSSIYDKSAIWSGMCSPSPTFNSLSNGFDGNLATTFYDGVSAGAYFTFTPTGGYSFNSQIRVYNGGVSDTSVKINGGASISLSTNSWTTVATGSGTLTTLAITRGVTQVHGWFAIEIDGKVLVDSNITPANVPSIASTVRANPSAGFSIVSYIGNNTSGSQVGHGLSSPAKFIIVKQTDATRGWPVYTEAVGPGGYLSLNTSGSTAGDAIWGNVAPTSSYFTISNQSEVNGSGGNYIAYCFAPVAGYSAFGSYTGNGSADGPFVFTGFRPAWLMVKSSSNSGEHWLILDAARDSYNVADATIYANLTNAEAEASVLGIDILSNGFKPRGTNAGTNASGYTYIYAAFCEHPAKTARAR